MPTYLFRCPNGHDFSLFEKMAEAGGKRSCPECGMLAGQRYSAPPVTYATDGFYSTDAVKSDNLPGTKRDRLNENWSKAWGEKPPEIPRDIDRNSREPQ